MSRSYDIQWQLVGIKVGYTWQSMCVRRSGSQWKVADVCWEEVLVLGVREDEREALVIHILMLVYLSFQAHFSVCHIMPFCTYELILL